jgi:hypothetical protein
LENATNFEETSENKKKLSTSASVEANSHGSIQPVHKVEKIKHSLTARSLNLPTGGIKPIEGPPSIAELVSLRFR